MFGFVQVNEENLNEEEMERYRATYCGLCFALKERYGQLSRFCLTYDLTFYVMLCNSLHEPVERTGKSPCIAQPGQMKSHVASNYSDHAADLSVILAYHKLLDEYDKDRVVCDYLSGMTDRYAITVFENLFIPTNFSLAAIG